MYMLGLVCRGLKVRSGCFVLKRPRNRLEPYSSLMTNTPNTNELSYTLILVLKR